MVNIENVDLRAEGIELPSERIGVVMAQPFLSLTLTEPFVCAPEAAGAQVATIQRTLDIAKSRSHGQEKTHFTVFPEYSIPGLPGVAAVDAALAAADWPNGTIVIGGLTALTKTEYATLLASANVVAPVASNGPNQVKDNDWLNCAVVWIKAANSVKKWVQPKLHPAWPEQNVHYNSMFQGASIFVFRGRLQNGAPYRFSILTCFDWIARVDNSMLWQHVLTDLAKQAEAADAESSLSWFFVIQHNPKPHHDTFLSQIPPFFDERSTPTVRRDKAAVVFANSAGKATPGRTENYGGSSLVFSDKSNFSKIECPLTFASGGQRFRNNSATLNPYHDIVFRENGACVLSFVQINPGVVAAGAANRAVAIERAELFSIGDCNDPRVPNGEVPAAVKWFNDQLDDVRSLALILPAAPLAARAAVTHNESIASLRTTAAATIAQTIALGTAGDLKSADTWEVEESAALALLVNAVEILAIGFGSHPMTAGTDLSTIAMGGHTLAVVTIKGASHQSCLEYAARHLPRTPHQFLLITKDQENTFWDRKEENFLKGDSPKLGMERKITDPDNNTLHLSYQDLLTLYRRADTADALREVIHARFT